MNLSSRKHMLVSSLSLFISLKLFYCLLNPMPVIIPLMFAHQRLLSIKEPHLFYSHMSKFGWVELSIFTIKAPSIAKNAF